MKVMTIHFAVCAVLLCLSPMATAKAQDKQKPGTTVDAWRESVPQETEALAQEEATVEVPLSVASPDETRRVLLSAEQRLMDSLKVRDGDSLSEIISSDFVFASPRIVDVKDRQTYLEFVLRDLRLAEYEFSDLTVRIFGKTAIVSGRLKQKASMKGEDWGGNYLITDVWLSRNGLWRIISRHESVLKEQGSGRSSK